MYISPHSTETFEYIFNLPNDTIAQELWLCTDDAPACELPNMTHHERASRLNSYFPSMLTIHVPLTEVPNTPEIDVSTCKSRNLVAGSPNNTANLNETFETSSFAFCVTNLVQGDDALRLLCDNSNCEKDFLNEVDKFQTLHNVLLTMAFVRIVVPTSAENSDVFSLDQLHLRVAGSTTCPQFDYEVQTDRNVYWPLNPYRVTSSFVCTALSPRNIHGYNFRSLPSPFEHPGYYRAGTVLSGYVRFWSPRRAGPKILMIDPFVRNEFSSFTSGKLCTSQGERWTNWASECSWLTRDLPEGYLSAETSTGPDDIAYFAFD